MGLEKYVGQTNNNGLLVVPGPNEIAYLNDILVPKLHSDPTSDREHLKEDISKRKKENKWNCEPQSSLYD